MSFSPLFLERHCRCGDPSGFDSSASADAARGDSLVPRPGADPHAGVLQLRHRHVVCGLHLRRAAADPGAGHEGPAALPRQDVLPSEREAQRAAERREAGRGVQGGDPPADEDLRRDRHPFSVGAMRRCDVERTSKGSTRDP